MKPCFFPFPFCITSSLLVVSDIKVSLYIPPTSTPMRMFLVGVMLPILKVLASSPERW